MITISGYSYDKFKFPVGELQIKIVDLVGQYPDTTDITFDYENNEEIFELLLICDTLKSMGVQLNTLYMDYVPFSRQDRSNEFGECFSLKVFCNLINSLNFKKVFILDPHSDVTRALINNVDVVEQHELFKKYFKDKKDFYLVSPDGGALKKIYKLAKEVDCLGVIECSKQRNTKTGEITAVTVPLGNFENKDCYIVDDIVDGGRTFIEIAKKLKEKDAGKVILMAAHCFMTKGIELFSDIDEIYSKYGRVK